MRVIALEETFRFLFSSRRFSTGASFTIASLAVEVYEDDNTTQITGADVSDDDYDGIAGLHEVEIAATAANGFEAGKVYTVVISAGTVDSVSVVGTVLYEFRIETAAERALRLYQEKVYLASIVTTTTGNTAGATNRVNLTDFLDAETADGDMVGSCWDYIRDATAQWQRFTIVSVQSARLFNVVVTADGSALDNAVAANDFLFFAGWESLRATVPGRTLDVSTGGEGGVDWANVGSPSTVVVLSGTTLHGTIKGTAATGTLSTTVATTDLSGYVNDELNGRVIIFTGGTAEGQAAAITDYASSSGTVTFGGGIATAPANGDTFIIV